MEGTGFAHSGPIPNRPPNAIERRAVGITSKAALVAVIIWGSASWLTLLAHLVAEHCTWQMVILAPAGLGFIYAGALPFYELPALRWLGAGIGVGLTQYAAIPLLELSILLAVNNTWEAAIVSLVVAVAILGHSWVCWRTLRGEWLWSTGRLTGAGLDTRLAPPRAPAAAPDAWQAAPLSREDPNANLSGSEHNAPDELRGPPLTASEQQQRIWLRMLVGLPLCGLAALGLVITFFAGFRFSWLWMGHVTVGLLAEAITLRALASLWFGAHFRRGWSAGVSALISFYTMGECAMLVVLPSARRLNFYLGFSPPDGVVVVGGLLLGGVAAVCLLAAVRLAFLEMRADQGPLPTPMPAEEIESAQGWDEADAGNGGGYRGTPT